MLRPTDRNHLFESLRPPEGYELDFALGTTYSLDLTTLLTIPIVFAFNNYDGYEADETPDPLLILESVRQFSSKIAVFCQMGQIYVPRLHPILNAYLENSVYQVKAPRDGGLFHAKVWVLRYAPHEKGSILYRVLCLSRNLTFDKSWDTVVALDGNVEENRTNAFSNCRSLSEFIAILPKLSIDRMSKQLEKSISSIKDEILYTRFGPPDGFEEILFWSLGLDTEKRSKSKFLSWPIKAVISPFICERFINEYLKEQTDKSILVSRRDSLDALNKKSLSNFDCIYTLEEGASEPVQESDSGPEDQTELTGLHAKIFLMESGWDASIVTGSANATIAAMTKNVEFMVELIGKKSKFGVDQLFPRIKDNKETAFADILVPYTPQEQVVTENEEKRNLEQNMDQFCRLLAERMHNGSIENGDNKSAYILRISMKLPLIFGKKYQTSVICRPITVSNMYGSGITAETTHIQWENLSIEALTEFIAFKVEMKSENEISTREFVVKIFLSGMPEDRLSGIISIVLQNRQQFIRLLLLILSMGEGQNPDNNFNLFIKPVFSQSINESGILNGLLERLLMAVSRNPNHIERIQALVLDLKKTEKGKTLLPDGFESLWNPILEAKRMRDG